MRDSDGEETPGMSATARAFQGGFSGGKSKDKTPKAKKIKPDSGGGSANNEAKGLLPATTTFQQASPRMFKHGGRVKKTGMALVHRGEYVVPAKQSRHKAAGRKRSVIKA